LKTQPHAVNACVKRSSQRSLSLLWKVSFKDNRNNWVFYKTEIILKIIFKKVSSYDSIKRLHLFWKSFKMKFLFLLINWDNKRLWILYLILPYFQQKSLKSIFLLVKDMLPLSINWVIKCRKSKTRDQGPSLLNF